MTRNLKILGLTLAAALALSALMASAAPASPALFTAEVAAGEQAEGHGEPLAGTTDTFSISGLPPMTCASVKERGFLEEGGAHKLGPSAPGVTGIPEPETCHIKLGVLTRTITMTTNDCTNTTIATKNTNGKPFTADLTVSCPNKPVEVHVYNTSNHNDTGAATLCTYDMPGQTSNNQIELTNTASHDVTVDINVSGITVHNTILSGTCGLNTNTTATFTGTHTIRATNEDGVFVNSTVS